MEEIRFILTQSSPFFFLFVLHHPLDEMLLPYDQQGFEKQKHEEPSGGHSSLIVTNVVRSCITIVSQKSRKVRIQFEHGNRTDELCLMRVFVLQRKKSALSGCWWP